MNNKDSYLARKIIRNEFDFEKHLLFASIVNGFLPNEVVKYVQVTTF